ncbi:PQQ-binding-like beta-propeller repeat protein [Cellulomonas sp. PhB150]|uniref:outer membrane protein assembly factor BamB family protein n=1 Tax=Cellulomonas sp. PhB150 TaxID=2485188 RepID=UPI000F4AD2B1|nr:PQQ-binding-like beta-propeller repeat protein [Cellulomonas sp. PhB150]ROS27976.1 outer membrane protein assembly factor BamB [Cellulomonas sp. PhB150]
MGRGVMQEVVVDDGTDDAAQVGPPTGSRRRRGWLAVPVGLVVVGVLVAAQHTIDDRERSEIARLADVPGVLEPVDQHLDVVTRATGADAAWMFTPEGSVVQAADGSQAYVWRDRRTGTVTGSVALLGPTPALAGSQFYDGTACQSDGGRVVCLVSDGGTPDSRGPKPKAIEATSTRVIAFRADDGSSMAEWPIDGGDSFAVLPGAVVVATLRDQTAAVTSYDLLTGEVRWQLQLGSRTELDDGGEAAQHVGIRLADDRLVVRSDDGRTAVVSTEGHLLRDVRVEAGPGFLGWSTIGPDHISCASLGSDGVPTTTVLSADGTPQDDLVLTGQEVAMTVDDGSLPGLMLTSAGTVEAWDATSGRSLWVTDDPVSAEQAIVLRGRVYVAGAGRIVAFDGRSGAALWTAGDPDRIVVSTSLLTDGRNILLPQDSSGGAGRGELVACDAVTGDEAFRARYPDGVTDLVSNGRQLVGYDASSEAHALLR